MLGLSMTVGSAVYVGLAAVQALVRLALLVVGWAAGIERGLSW